MLDGVALEGVEAVVHLGGRNIAGGRWTKKIKAELRRSRVQTTELLAATLAGLAAPPRVFICASAIGIYGDRGDEKLHEESGPGTGFLAELGQAWEGASAVAADAGIRVVHARFGIVLSRERGALAKMLTPFRLGVGGKIGNGRQYFSWIGLEDAVAALVFALAAVGVVFIAAVLLTPAGLPPGTWLHLSVALLLGSIPFGLLGIALGYWAQAKAALPLANLLYLSLAYAGGLWLPPDRLLFPRP